MGFFSNLARPFRAETKAVAAVPLSSPDAFGIFGVAPSGSGISIDGYSALKCAPVLAGVKIISEAVSQLDLCLFREADEGREAIKAVDHPAAKLMERPNGWTGETEFKRQIVQDFLLWGNGLALVTRVAGNPVELHRIDPRSCSITFDLNTLEPEYRVALQSGGSQLFSYKDVIHLRGTSVDGIVGLGLTNLGQEAIGLSIILERHAAKLFGKGAKPSGILEVVKALGKDAKDRLKSSFELQHSGADNSGGTLILEDGITFKPVTMNSTDAQFLEMRKFQVLEIARLLNVPPSMLADLERTTHSNAEELGQQFLNMTLGPILELFEDALERTLLSEEERDAGFEIEFDTSNLVKADTEKRFAAYKTGIESGVLSINQAKAKEGLPAVDGGDTPMRSVQTIPLTSIDPQTQQTAQGVAA